MTENQRTEVKDKMTWSKKIMIYMMLLMCLCMANVVVLMFSERETASVAAMALAVLAITCGSKFFVSLKDHKRYAQTLRNKNNNLSA